MLVRAISGFTPLFFRSLTTSTVAFANKSSDKLEAKEAERKRSSYLYRKKNN